MEPFGLVYGTLGFRGTHFGNRCFTQRHSTVNTDQ